MGKADAACSQLLSLAVPLPEARVVDTRSTAKTNATMMRKLTADVRDSVNCAAYSNHLIHVKTLPSHHSKHIPALIGVH